MKKKTSLFITLLMVVLAIFVYWCIQIKESKSLLTESEAVSLLKSTYPEFQSYPNDNLPPQSIKVEANADGWYIAFVQEGSGRPILHAKCFFVKKDGTYRSIGEFNPAIDDFDFSLRTCSKK